jgi:hypothetical protein
VILLPVDILFVFIVMPRMCVQQACLIRRFVCHGFAYSHKNYSDHPFALGCSSLGGQSGTGMGFSLSTLLFPCHHSTNNPYSLHPSAISAV